MTTLMFLITNETKQLICSTENINQIKQIACSPLNRVKTTALLFLDDYNV